MLWLRTLLLKCSVQAQREGGGGGGGEQTGARNQMLIAPSVQDNLRHKSLDRQ